MSSGEQETQDSAVAKEARIQLLLEDCLRRRAAGEAVSDTSLMAAHPEAMPELGEALRKLRLIAATRKDTPKSSDGDDEKTLEHKLSSGGSHGLHIRCPHCCNFVEVLTDTPYEEICCTTCGSNFSLVDRQEATRFAEPLKSIGRFDLISRLGIGGFGTVWKSRDRELDRTVAVKIPRRGQLSSAQIDQFFREARAAAQLHHPNIVSVHEVGREGDTIFIVSDFIRGVTLTDWITVNPLSAGEVAELCLPIADALHHAHQQGIVHRDFKPSNVMMDESGRPHLTDFGLAKRELGEITMTIEGQILGTPGYMSPEQARGQAHWTDRRSDIYSFGVVMFQLLTSELPFRGSPQMQIHQRLTEDAPDPRKLNRHVPRDMSTICLKCLEREPGRRFATAAELSDELKRFLNGEPLKSRPISAPMRAARWAKRKPWVAATLLMVGILAIAGPIVALGIESQRRQLEMRYRERNELILNTKQDVDRLQKSNKQLADEITAWTGKAKPSEYWPPKSVPAPRQDLAADLFNRSETPLTAALRGGKFDAEQSARGYMALAILSEAVGNQSVAKTNYLSARDVLQDVNVLGAGTSLLLGTSGNPLHLVAGDDLSIQGGAVLEALFGSHLIANDLSAAGLNGILSIDGAGSNLTLSGTELQNIGSTAGSNSLVFSNGSGGRSNGPLGVVDTKTANATGSLAVLSGSSVELFDNLTVATGNAAGQVGTVDIHDVDSLLTVKGSASITVGAAANGTATIDIGVSASGGTLTTGTGTMTINKTATVTIGSSATAGTLNASGNVTINGGTLTRSPSGIFNLATGHTFTVQNGGEASFAGSGGYTATDGADLPRDRCRFHLEQQRQFNHWKRRYGHAHDSKWRERFRLDGKGRFRLQRDWHRDGHGHRFKLDQQ